MSQLLLGFVPKMHPPRWSSKLKIQDGKGASIMDVHSKMHTVLNLNKEVRFHLLSIFLEPVVQFGWNLKWGTFFKKRLKWNSFKGQKGHIKATWLTFWPLFGIFSENSKRPIQKLPVFEKKVLKKFVPRPAAFKSTVSFMTNFLWSYSSILHQI